MLGRRSKPRRGQPTKAEKQAIRQVVFDRAEGRCQLNLVAECLGWVPLDGDPFDHTTHGHLVHIKAKRVHGWEDSNLVWGCWICHAFLHNGLKPVPKKDRPL